VVSFLLSFCLSVFPHLISAAADWICLPYFHTWCGPSANLECRSETCCTRLAANAGPKKVSKNCHLGSIAQLCRAISSQLRPVLTIGKNFLSSNISSRCPHNMVNFGPLAAEIVSLVWDTPGNFNGSRILAASLHSTLVVVISQTAALNRVRHLYLAGRPSRWASAHISSLRLKDIHCFICLLILLLACTHSCVVSLYKKFISCIWYENVGKVTLSKVTLASSSLSDCHHWVLYNWRKMVVVGYGCDVVFCSYQYVKG